jgi:hypothetical protein
MLDDLAASTPTPMSTSTSTPVPRATPTVIAPTVSVIPASPVSSPRLHSLQELVCRPEFTWPCGWALAVVWCESTNNPNAQAVEVIDGVTYYFNGYWQVLGGSFDPYENTLQAHVQYSEWQRGERQRPWPNCP